MSVCLNSSKGIFCHGCGKEIHEDRCFGKKGFIKVEFTLAERPFQDNSGTCTPSYNLEVCGIECLKKVDWAQVKAEIERHEREYGGDYYKKHDKKMGIE